MTDFKRSICAALLGVSLSTVSAPLIAQEQVIIVFDVSGSMWGHIEGRAKIEIAREVLADVLGQLPAEKSLGLMAYGHRHKGDCSDIELVVPPAPGRANAMIDVVNVINPKGKTPLSDAAKQAAEALKYTEEKATVILITDGVETCNADPCALARHLEERGVDFTTHVVGLGLSKEEGAQVSCLAEATGGKYLQAKNADALADALTQAVVVQSEPAPVPEPAPALPAYNLRLTTSLAPGGPLLQDPHAKWSLTHRETGATERFEGSTQEVTLPEGVYDVNLGLGGWSFTGQANVVKTDAQTVHLDLNMGVLTVNVLEGAARTRVTGRFRAEGKDASGAEVGGGYATGQAFYFPAGEIRLSAQKGSYIHSEQTLDLAAGEMREEELHLAFGTVSPSALWTNGGGAVDQRVMVKLFTAKDEAFAGQVVAGSDVSLGAGSYIARAELGYAQAEKMLELAADAKATPALVFEAAPVSFQVDKGAQLKRWAVLDAVGKVLFSSSRADGEQVLPEGTYTLELRLREGAPKHIPFQVTAGQPITVTAAP